MSAKLKHLSAEELRALLSEERERRDAKTQQRVDRILQRYFKKLSRGQFKVADDHIRVRLWWVQVEYADPVYRLLERELTDRGDSIDIDTWQTPLFLDIKVMG